MYRYHTNRQGLVPLGKGSLCSSINKISANTRDRAVKANIVEVTRTNKLKSIFDQQKKESEILAAKVINKTFKSLKEKDALQYILQTDYSMPCFKTLQHDFSPRNIYTPKTSRHIKTEMKVYDVGFDRRLFQTEIGHRLMQTDPKRRREKRRQKLLIQSRRQSDIEIDRNITKSAFQRMLHDPSKLDKYQYQRKPTLVRFEGE